MPPPHPSSANNITQGSQGSEEKHSSRLEGSFARLKFVPGLKIKIIKLQLLVVLHTFTINLL